MSVYVAVPKGESDDGKNYIFRFANTPLTSIEEVDVCLDQIIDSSKRLDKLIKKIDVFLGLPPEKRTLIKLKRLDSTLEELLNHQKNLTLSPSDASLNDPDYIEIEDEDLASLETLKNELAATKNRLDVDKITIATKLAELHDTGGEIWESDQEKAFDILPNAQKKIKYDRIVNSKTPAPFTEKVIDNHAYGHAVRLFFVRGFRLLSYFVPIFTVLVSLFAFKLIMGFLSVLYFVGVCFTLKEVYNLSYTKEGKFSWTLFCNAWRENGWKRAALLVNDLLWTAWNSIAYGYFLNNSPETSTNTLWNIGLHDNDPIKIADARSDEVNILGFFLDIFSDGGAAFKRWKYPTLLLKIGCVLGKVNEAIQDYNVVKLCTEKTAKEKQRRFYRTLLVAGLIFAGAFMIYIPTLFPAIMAHVLLLKYAGGTCSFLGSLIGGWGGRIRDGEQWQNAMDWLGDKLDSCKCAWQRWRGNSKTTSEQTESLLPVAEETGKNKKQHSSTAYLSSKFGEYQKSLTATSEDARQIPDDDKTDTPKSFPGFMLSRRKAPAPVPTSIPPPLAVSSDITPPRRGGLFASCYSS